MRDGVNDRFALMRATSSEKPPIIRTGDRPDPRKSSSEPHLAALSRSPIYLEFQRAFTQGTGLPLSLHAPQTLGLVRYFGGQQNRFCSLLAGAARTCSACYALQQQLARDARLKAKRLTCFAGLCETAVPV